MWWSEWYRRPLKIQKSNSTDEPCKKKTWTILTTTKGSSLPDTVQDEEQLDEDTTEWKNATHQNTR